VRVSLYTHIRSTLHRLAVLTVCRLSWTRSAEEAVRVAAAAAARQQAEAEARAAAAKAKEEEAARKAAAAAKAAAEAAARKAAEEQVKAAAAEAESKRVLDAAIARGLEMRRAQRQQQEQAHSSRHGAVVELTGGSMQLRQLLSAHVGVIVDWSAPWCGPCRMMAPHFESAAAQHPGVCFVSVNTEGTPANAALALEAGITAYPTFHAYIRGSRTEEWRGADLVKLRAVAAQLQALAQAAPSTTPAAAAPVSTAPVPRRETDPDAMAQRVAESLGVLRRACTLPEFGAAVRSLLIFVGNVVTHPTEARYRRVRIANAAFATSLGSRPGGVDALCAFGFERGRDDATGEEVLTMPEAAALDPALRRVKGMLEEALRAAGPAANGEPAAAGAAPTPLFPPAPGLGTDALASFFGGAGGGAGSMAQQQAAVAAALANNPMARAAAASVASNPDALAAMMMRPEAQALMAQMNPQMAAMMRDPVTLQQMVRMAAPGLAALVGGTSGSMSGLPPPAAPQITADALASALAGLAQPQQDHQPQQAAQQQMTEDEMLAEAIRRSLEDSGPGGPGGATQ
jgi:thioredoxin 1